MGKPFLWAACIFSKWESLCYERLAFSLNGDALAGGGLHFLQMGSIVSKCEAFFAFHTNLPPPPTPPPFLSGLPGGWESGRDSQAEVLSSNLCLVVSTSSIVILMSSNFDV